jgi:hypothetical protein
VEKQNNKERKDKIKGKRKKGSMFITLEERKSC